MQRLYYPTVEWTVDLGSHHLLLRGYNNSNNYYYYYLIRTRQQKQNTVQQTPCLSQALRLPKL